MATLDKSLLLEMFRKMEEIRRMDLKIAQLVKKGKCQEWRTFLLVKKQPTLEQC